MNTEVFVPNCEIRDQQKSVFTFPPCLRTRPLTRNKKSLIESYRSDRDVASQLGRALGFRLSGSFEPALISRVLNSLVDRHRALRTVYSVQDCVAHELAQPYCVHQLLDATSWTDKYFEDQLQQSRKLRFDLESGPLFRALVFRRALREYVIVLCAHEIVADTASFEILFNDFRRILSECAIGRNAMSPSMFSGCSSQSMEDDTDPGTGSSE